MLSTLFTLQREAETTLEKKKKQYEKIKQKTEGKKASDVCEERSCQSISNAAFRSRAFPTPRRVVRQDVRGSDLSHVTELRSIPDAQPVAPQISRGERPGSRYLFRGGGRSRPYFSGCVPDLDFFYALSRQTLLRNRDIARSKLMTEKN